jgi:hypothetical protein
MEYYRLIYTQNLTPPELPEGYLQVSSSPRWTTVATTKGWDAVKVDFPECTVAKTSEKLA